MVYLYASSFTNNQFRSHGVVVSCFVFFVRVEVGMVASFNPHMESGVVPPTSPHQVSSCQVLLGLSFVHVEHEEH